MMFSLSRPRVSAIGLHWGTRWVSMIQLKMTANAADVAALAQGTVPDCRGRSAEEAEATLAAFLKLMVADHGFRGRDVISCVSAEDLFLQSVRLPQLPADEFQRVVRMEAQERLPYPVDSAELRHLLAGQIRQDSAVKQEAVLMSCPRVVVDRQVRILEQAGLQPIAIDAEPCAVLRAFRHEQPDSADRIAYLHLGEHVGTVVIADGDALLFLKYVGAGGKELDQAVAKHLDLEPAEAHRLRSGVTNAAALDPHNEVHRSVIEAIRPQLETLASEIELCFRYFMVTFRGQPLAKLIVTGTEASGWLAEYLGQSLSCRVEVGDPFTSLAKLRPVKAIPDPGRWSVALGLALRNCGA